MCPASDSKCGKVTRRKPPFAVDEEIAELVRFEFVLLGLGIIAVPLADGV